MCLPFFFKLWKKWNIETPSTVSFITYIYFAKSILNAMISITLSSEFKQNSELNVAYNSIYCSYRVKSEYLEFCCIKCNMFDHGLITMLFLLYSFSRIKWMNSFYSSMAIICCKNFVTWLYSFVLCVCSMPVYYIKTARKPGNKIKAPLSPPFQHVLSERLRLSA